MSGERKAESGERKAGRPDSSAFTLIEIMVSIMIFTVVAVAMVTVLLMGTNLFRQGEYSRSANDEAVAVLGSIDEDLKHILPREDGGFIYSKVSDEAGNTVIAFAIANPDPNTIAATGDNAYQIVAYWVSGDNLYRTVLTMFKTTADGAGPPSTPGAKWQVRNDLPRTPVAGVDRLITSGCLHLGAWIADQYSPATLLPEPTKRPLVTDGPDWEKWDLANNDSVLAPWVGVDFDTDRTGAAPNAYPSAIRLAVTLTGGGRFVPQGRLAQEKFLKGDREFSVLGVKGVPSVPGSVIRIDNEWVFVESVRNGTVTIPKAPAISPLGGRGARRSDEKDHFRGAVVQFGQTYSLARTLSH